MLKLMGPLASIPGLCYSKPSITVLHRMNSILPKTENEWEKWLDCVRYNDLAPLVLNSFLRHRLSFPVPIQKQLEDLSLDQRLKARKQQSHLIELLKALYSKKIPFLLLGLQSYVEELFGDQEALPHSSVKLLFRPQDLFQLPSIYKNLGLECPALPNEKSWLRQASPSHWPSYLTPDQSLVVDTYWVTEDSNPFSQVADWGYWRRAETFFYYDIPCLRLSKEDFIHYTGLQMSPYGVSLVHLLTLLNARHLWNEIDWPRIAELGKQSQTSLHIYRALSYTQCLYFDNDLHQFLKNLSSPSLKELKRRIHFLTENPTELMWAEPKYKSTLDELILKFYLESHFFRKWAYLWRILKVVFFSEAELLARMTFAPKPRDFIGKAKLHCSHLLLIPRAYLYEKGWKQYLLDIFLMAKDLMQSIIFPKKSRLPSFDRLHQ